jgi:hypothetical protein
MSKEKQIINFLADLFSVLEFHYLLVEKVDVSKNLLKGLSFEKHIWGADLSKLEEDDVVKIYAKNDITLTRNFKQNFDCFSHEDCPICKNTHKNITDRELKL